MSDIHVGTLLACPGCKVGTVLDAIGSALFDVGHFNCPACGARWTECFVPDCYGYDPECSCQQYDGGGFVPYVSLMDRLAESAP